MFQKISRSPPGFLLFWACRPIGTNPVLCHRINTCMKHRHHIIPRHAGGTDDPSNLVLLTLEEHIAAHKALFEEHGRWQDRVAYQAMSGMIGREEAILQTQIEGGRTAGKARPNADARRKIGEAQIGNQKAKGHIHTEAELAKMRQPRKNGNGHIGLKHSAETKAKMSASAKGRTFSDETRAKLRASQKARRLREQANA